MPELEDSSWDSFIDAYIEQKNRFEKLNELYTNAIEDMAQTKKKKWEDAHDKLLEEIKEANNG